jgi:hypothetical protein
LILYHLKSVKFSRIFVGEISPSRRPGIIPEPSTFLLLGAGLVGVGLLRKRFKK